MELKLTVYTSDELKEVKRVAEAERVKIPYRVATGLIESLDGLNIDNEGDLVKLVGSSAGKLNKIIKATFGISENELDCVDGAELGAVAMELYKWAIDKIKSIKGNDSKNVVTAAQNN